MGENVFRVVKAMNNDTLKKILLISLLVGILAASNAAVFFAVRKDADTKMALLQNQTQTQLAALQGEIIKIQTNVQTSNEKTSTAISEVAHQQAIQKAIQPAPQPLSQDQLLTQAVAKVTPAVVSIVISKDVPQLDVTYENPFSNDPLFQNLGIQVPVYHQKGTTKQKVGGGTGFIITKNGYIITNRHVVEDTSASYTALLSDGRQLPVTVVYKDAKQDVAIVKIEGQNFPMVALGDSANLKAGQSVFAIGNVLAEYNNSVSVGIISGLNRTIQAGDENGGNVEELSGIIQTDAAINPGNSGGPLVDLNGKVVGVNVATVQGASSIGFSVPINIVKPIVDLVVK